MQVGAVVEAHDGAGDALPCDFGQGGVRRTIRLPLRRTESAERAADLADHARMRDHCDAPPRPCPRNRGDGAQASIAERAVTLAAGPAEFFVVLA